MNRTLGFICQEETRDHAVGELTPEEKATLAAVRKVLPRPGDVRDLRLFLNDTRKSNNATRTRVVKEVESERSRQSMK